MLNSTHPANERPWREWYKSERWRSLKESTFERDRNTCQKCGRSSEPFAIKVFDGECVQVPLLICDHVAQHRGDERKFFDPENLLTLCIPCHDHNM